MIPEAGVPLSHDELVAMLIRVRQPGKQVAVITTGKDHVGVGIIVTSGVPHGKELFALDVTANALPSTHTVHLLYAGDVVSMQGSC